MFCGTEQEANLLSQIVLFCFFLSVEASGKSSLEMLRKGRQLKKNTQQVTRWIMLVAVTLLLQAYRLKPIRMDSLAISNLSISAVL